MNRIKSKWHGALAYDKADMIVPIYEPTPTYTSGSDYVRSDYGPTYVDGRPVYTDISTTTQEVYRPEPEVTAPKYPLYKEPEIVSPYRPDPLLDTEKPEITRPTIEKPTITNDVVVAAKPIEAGMFNFDKKTLIIGGATLALASIIFIIKKQRN